MDGEEGRKEKEPSLVLHVVLCKHLKELWTFDFRFHFCRRKGRVRTGGGDRKGEGWSLASTGLLSITAICPVLSKPRSSI